MLSELCGGQLSVHVKPEVASGVRQALQNYGVPSGFAYLLPPFVVALVLYSLIVFVFVTAQRTIERRYAQAGAPA
jgi:hypothetical protein